MPVRTKQILKDFFQTGFRPTESNFADLVDSFMHKNALTEDGVSFDDQNLTIGGGVTMGAAAGATAPDTPGTIRWNSTTETFEFFRNPLDGWVVLGSNLSSDWSLNGDVIEYTAGNARVNDSVFGNIEGGIFDGFAFFGHAEAIGNDGFALAQNNDGDVAIRAVAGRNIQFFIGNSLVLSLDEDGNLNIPGALTASNFP